jgi:hypothetical protein
LPSLKGFASMLPTLFENEYPSLPPAMIIADYTDSKNDYTD